MPLDASPQRPRFREHEQPRNVRRMPSEPVGSDGWSQPDFLVEFPEHGFDSREVRLDFDDHQDPKRGPEREHINRPALAELRVRHFDLNKPATFGQKPGQLAGERRVILVEQPVERTGAPTHIERQPGVECLHDFAQGWDGWQMTRFGA
jgi:hypothetical protein